ncbi:MAG: response regulator [Methylococcales bacterium]|nr:response regulator [Methylococcales bacterium]MCK5478112.1 response regulator [Methylococcales bacterium]
MLTNLPPQTVLIVDDEITNIKVLSALLRDDLEILFATSGTAALDMALSKKPDLVLLDIMMPGIDGYEVCRRLKANPQTTHIPVIFVTAKDQEQDEADGFEAGAIDFITKPFSPLIVKARVRNHLNLIGQRNQLRQLSDKLEAYHQRVDHELQTARETQSLLLPGLETLNTIYQTHQLNIDSYFEPCSELGGDYWGIRTLNESCIAVLIADFSGHGVNAALNTFRLHALLDNKFSQPDNPAAFMEELNIRLSPLLPTGQYATAFYGIIDLANDRLCYSAAATPSPLIMMPGQQVPIIGSGEGFPLGMFDESNYENRELAFPAGASLLLYSDAVTEAKLIQGGRFQEQGLVELVTQSIANLPGKQRLSTLIKKLNDQFVHPLSDDFTMVYINRENDSSRIKDKS